jgi:hypothetical protein
MKRRLGFAVLAVALVFPPVALAFNNGDQVTVRTSGEVMRTLRDGRVVVATSGGVVVLPASAVSAATTPMLDARRPSPTASPTPTVSPTATPTVPVTAEPTATPTQDTSQFPTPDDTGVPADWVPAKIVTQDMTINTPGTVIRNVEFDNASVYVNAPNVTIEDSDFKGGHVETTHNCQSADPNSLIIQDTTFEPPPGRDR